MMVAMFSVEVPHDFLQVSVYDDAADFSDDGLIGVRMTMRSVLMRWKM